MKNKFTLILLLALLVSQVQSGPTFCAACLGMLGLSVTQAGAYVACKLLQQPTYQGTSCEQLAVGLAAFGAV